MAMKTEARELAVFQKGEREPLVRREIFFLTVVKKPTPV